MPYTTHPNGDFLTRPGGYNVSRQILDQEITMSRYIDCTVDNLVSGAFYKIFSVPAGFQINEAYVTCLATEGTDTLDIVDDDNATTVIVNNAALSAVGVVTATTARKYYATDGFICIRPKANLTTFKGYVTIKGIVLNKNM